ncbi:MAG: ABC transporter permease subunit [Candidatus Cloacimonetes bacterium]|nr:ABC transporter permease subunit [Candidatus Cloacimonadota bacterium]
MFKSLFYKDLMLLIKDFKFQVFFIILMILFILSGIASANQVKKQQKEYQEEINSEMKYAQNNSGRMMYLIANQGIKYYHTPGISDMVLETKGFPTALGTNILHFNPYAYKRTAEGYSFSLNWLFILGLIGSLMVLIFSFDSLSEEKINGMLKLQTISGLSRSQIVFSKFLSILTLYLLAIIPAGTVSLLLFSGMTGLFSFLFLVKTILFILFSIPLISFFILIGIWISLSRHHMSNIVIALSFWLIFIIIIPQLASIVGKKISPIASHKEMNQRIQDAASKVHKEYYKKYTFDFGGNGTLEKGIRSKGFDAADAARAKQAGLNREIYFKQIETIEKISFLSPYSIFKHVTEIIFDKNFYRMKKDIDHLQIIQQAIKDEILEEDKKDPASMHLCYAYAEGDKYAVMNRGVTPFSDKPYPHPEKLINTDFQEESLLVKLQHISLWLFAMIMIDMLLLGTINMIFRKYDIR